MDKTTEASEEMVEFEGQVFPIWVKFIHTTLKTTVINTLLFVIKGIPASKLVDNRDKLESAELRRQWDVLDRAVKKAETQLGIDWDGIRPESVRCGKALYCMRTIYFTIIQYDAMWQNFAAIVWDENRKER